ncbi:MAG: hypothetical protein O7E57_01445 [Gammaproteobacteria bacterium]|nr:hypothetical protein [Gammaproteobacteria bacterium]
MKSNPAMRAWRTWIGVGFVAALAMAALILPVQAEKRTTRVGPEVKMGGLTVAEEAARQRELNVKVTALLPAGVDKTPLQIEITQKDRDDLSVPARPGVEPLRVGVVKAVPGATGKPFGKAFNQGVIEKGQDGNFVWALRVNSPGAQAIRLHFTGFSLPDNTEMYFIGPGGQAHGPYVGEGRNGNGDFWTRSIVSDTGRVVLHYTGNRPEVDRAKMSFVISDVGHIRGRPPRPREQSHDSWPCADNAPCVVDVNCLNTGPAAPAEDAVAKMEWIQGPFVFTCSGGLLADTDSGSQIPYFLSANHCLSTNNSNLETFFNYTTTTCNGVCPDSIVTGGTPPPASTVGVTIKATGTGGDFSLFTLNQAPPAGAVFLGWNNTPIANTNGANLYRISNPNFGPQAYSQHDVDTARPTCSTWPRGERIYSSDIVGATLGGSSGSPVLNSASEVVGQLSGCCGFNCAAECDSASNATVDGALAFYWDSVSEFLDPVAECISDLECDDGLFCTGAETCVGGSCQSSGDPCTGGTACNETTNTCDTPVCDNNNSCDPGEDCNNCPNDCRNIKGRPSNRFCCDGDLPVCGDARCAESGWSCAGAGCTSDLDCDDGLFCNGAETCVGGSCQPGGDPCPGQGCDEGSNLCVACGGNKASCNINADCCSNNCRNGTCRGN